jgi:hypothetical protein
LTHTQGSSDYSKWLPSCKRFSTPDRDNDVSYHTMFSHNLWLPSDTLTVAGAACWEVQRPENSSGNSLPKFSILKFGGVLQTRH